MSLLTEFLISWNLTSIPLFFSGFIIWAAGLQRERERDREGGREREREMHLSSADSVFTCPHSTCWAWLKPGNRNFFYTLHMGGNGSSTWRMFSAFPRDMVKELGQKCNRTQAGAYRGNTACSLTCYTATRAPTSPWFSSHCFND